METRTLSFTQNAPVRSAPAVPPELPPSCAELADRLAGTALAELSAPEVVALSRRHDDASAGPRSEDNEILQLLTRPFSLRLPIPEYYRYSGLHVIGWFLARRGDAFAGGLQAAYALIADLAQLEDREAGRHLTTVAESAERVRRLRAVLDHLERIPVAPGRTAGEEGLIGPAAAAPAPARDLLVLTRCSGFRRSDKFDEHIFIRAVQACEVAFYLIRWAARRAGPAAAADSAECLFRMEQVAACAELLNAIFYALRTLTPELFLGFRDATGEASAVQSLNYHLMELVVYGYDGRKAETYHRFPHLAVVRDPRLREFRSLHDAARTAADPTVRAAFLELETQHLLAWRGRHYGFGRRYLPDMKGSGGTEGAGYLKRFVHKTGLDSGSRLDDPEKLLAEFAFR